MNKLLHYINRWVKRLNKQKSYFSEIDQFLQQTRQQELRIAKKVSNKE